MAKTVVAVVLIASSLLLGGCVQPQSQSPTASDYYASFRHQRQELMRERWNGRLYAELVAEMGTKGVRMTTPSSDGVPHTTVIYGVNDPLSGCVDSFVLSVDDDPVVEGYFCR